MKKIFLLVVNFFTGLCVYALDSNPRWHINKDGSITWAVTQGESHFDHIEMSGLKLSAVLRYGVNKDGSFNLERNLVWPALRTIPNDTHGSLMRRFAWNPLSMITVEGFSLQNEQVSTITLNGMMIVKSKFAFDKKYGIELTREIFPSTTLKTLCEKYTLKNIGAKNIAIEIPSSVSEIQTDPKKGVKGSYRLITSLQGNGTFNVAPNAEISFSVFFSGYDKDEKIMNPNIDTELKARQALISGLWSNLVLETPDPVINTMFAFAKIRGAESIYDTKGGLMHGPGGEAYYAAIWANDQAEYINPFFPFLGYETGNRSAMNSFRHFARFMNNEYKPIPSSIVAEGDNIWNGAGDRGDAAMIAYGAARYALASGNKEDTKTLWPLIKWCLEYCKRRLNNAGVVKSDKDELEGRFPAGTANLTTSCLYYDALLSASYISEQLAEDKNIATEYRKEATELRKNIEKYFGTNVEGFNTYRYYDGNTVLRSWICVPLTVGIFERKDETIRALFSERLWTKNGLLTQAGSETFWDRSTLYALRGVFAAGETEKALHYLKFYSRERLLGDHVPYAIEAWPEGNQRHLSAESGLYCRIITEGLFGIRPTGFRSFEITPHLPAEWNSMKLKNIHAFNSGLDIIVKRKKMNLNVSVLNKGKAVFNKTINNGEKIIINI